jgi:hypothetical protein
MEDLQIIKELDPESIRAQRYLYHFVTMLGSTLMANFWYVVLFGDDVLIIIVDVVLFFQGKDFIISLGMVGCLLAAVI